MKKKPQKILWIALFKSLGDAVLFYPTLQRCQEIFPDAHFEILVRNRTTREMLLALGFEGPITILPGNLFSILILLLQRGPHHFDLVFDASSMQPLRLSRLLAFWFSGSRIGFDYGWLSRLYSIKLAPGPIGRLHQKNIFAQLLAGVGERFSPELCLPPPRPALLNDCNLPLSPKSLRIVMHPGGRDFLDKYENHWPLFNFILLARRLSAPPDVHVVMLGIKEEKEWIEHELQPELDGKIINAAGHTSVGEFIEVVRSAALFIGNNSGPVHIAAAAGVPLITFAGGVSQTRRGIAESPKAITLGLDKRCPEAITVDEAYAAACGLLDQRAGTVKSNNRKR
jgi:ADP-heptose:LPS heptosyltransferase